MIVTGHAIFLDLLNNPDIFHRIQFDFWLNAVVHYKIYFGQLLAVNDSEVSKDICEKRKYIKIICDCLSLAFVI